MELILSSKLYKNKVLNHFILLINNLINFSTCFILRYDDLGNAVNCSDPNEQYSGQKVDLWSVKFFLRISILIY